MAANELLLNGLFYFFAAFIVGGAAGVALSKNIVRSAFSLLAVLGAVAALYGILKADFLVAVQVLIYVGGILVLILFAVMLTHKISDVKLSNDSRHSAAAALLVVAVVGVLSVVILTHVWRPIVMTDEALQGQYAAAGATGAEPSLTKALGRGLMREYLLPFEAVSVLLLAALVGAAYLARKEGKE